MRYETIKATVRGGLCGRLWMPAVMAGMPHTFDLRQRFDRFSDPSGATFRDALLSELNEHGGDFQDASFTADTELVILRRGTAPCGHVVTREKRIELAKLKDCADLVNAEAFTWDFCHE